MNVTANATRQGNWWAVEVPEVPGLFTQARRLDLIEAEVRDAAATLGIEVDTVTLAPELDGSLRDQLEAARAGAADLLRFQSEVAARSRAVALTLKESGYSVRDIGKLMHVSPQRASQLTSK